MQARQDVVGSHIGQYRLIKKIGSGGMGTVYLGEHILLGRRAAIKMLQPALSTQPEIVERFFREAKATSSITDPGVVQIFDFGYHVDGTAYIVMELLQGEALSARLERLGRLSAAEALRIVRQLAGALASAHANHIVHRDLKPENVYLVADPESPSGERVKLLDFGICKIESDATATQTGRMLGTPVYMSPEQCQGAREVDARSDIYSLGCVLFHTLTGQVPFDLEGTGDIIVAHIQAPPPKPSHVAPELSALIDEIVEHCLAKNPDERFQTMAAVQAAIDNVLPDLTPPPARDLPANIALGAGFKSDVGATPPATRDKDDWFVSEISTPMLTGELHVVRNDHRRSLTAILSSAVIVAVIVGLAMQTRQPASDPDLGAVIDTMSAAQLAIEKDLTMPEPKPDPIAATPVEPTLPTPELEAPKPAPELGDQQPPQPEIEQPAPTPEPEVERPVEQPEAEQPITEPPAEKPAKRARRARPHVAPTPRPQPAPSAEDLYETR